MWRALPWPIVMTLQLIRLQDIPYLDLAHLAGRQVVLLPFWDGSRWHAWVPVEGGYWDMKPVDAAHSDYVAERAAREDDLFVPFIDLMWQRASWPDVAPRISAISDDFHNLFASVAKLQLFQRLAGELSTYDHEAFARTELEYMFTVGRSIFDLVQEIIRTIWQDTKLSNPEDERRRRSRKLPERFSRVVLNRGATTSQEELVDTYALPPALCQAYLRQVPFFVQLRRIRERTVHGFGGVPRIALTERGLAISAADKLFDGLITWTDEHHFNDRLVSLLPIVAKLVIGTVGACSDLVQAFARQIVLPPELAPGKHIFVRSPHSFVVVPLLAAVRNDIAWWPRSAGPNSR